MKVILYHGSENIVTPKYGDGKLTNDYGQGFYCTESLELAEEWACSHGKDGYANSYELSMDGLSIMNLNDDNYNILNWLAVLLDNRKFPATGAVANTAKRYILENFLPDYKGYDLIKGYRADDSYFSFAGDFVGNGLSLNDLKEAMQLGQLGEQIVLKSEKAFAQISLIDSFPAPADEYFTKYLVRDAEARARYKEIATHPFAPENTYVLDIIREQMKDGDPRLR